MESTALFSKTPPLKLFAIAALPGSVSMLASALYQLLDGAFVGRLLGETAFAALNLAMPFVIINFSIADLIGVGSSVLISHSSSASAPPFTSPSALAEKTSAKPTTSLPAPV